jgi:ATP-binding cassette subfamily C (CFTR/MRP) protein 1
LDDPLSALDAHIGKFIFRETICKLLKNKTRILVTHALYFANELDYIYLFNEGEIFE